MIEWHYAGRRKWAEANDFVVKMEEKIAPFYADYLLQKAAKDTYLRERQSFDGHYDQAEALPYPSGPMSDLMDEIREMVPLIDDEEGKLDFVKAREQLRAAAEKLAELFKLDTRSEREAVHGRHQGSAKESRRGSGEIAAELGPEGCQGQD